MSRTRSHGHRVGIADAGTLSCPAMASDSVLGIAIAPSGWRMHCPSEGEVGGAYKRHRSHRSGHRRALAEPVILPSASQRFPGRLFPSRPSTMLTVRLFALRARQFDIRHGVALLRHVNRRNSNADASTSACLFRRLAKRTGKHHPAAHARHNAIARYEPEPANGR